MCSAWDLPEGLEKEQLAGNGPLAALPSRTQAPSPLAGRQEKPGAVRHPLAPVPRPDGLLGCCSSPGKAAAARAASLFTDASGEPTQSCLALLADSCDPTVDGPAPKRARQGAPTSRGFGLAHSGWGGSWGGWGGSASAGSCGSDDDSDGEEAASRKRPTPQKGAAPSCAAAGARLTAAPTYSAALHPAAAAARAAAVTAAPRLAAQHPPPTWAASMQRGGAMVGRPGGSAPAAAVMGRQEPECDPMELSQGSDVEEEERWLAGQPWQRFPAPHPLDVEE